ncbi:MAG: enoyl-CoA hydratase-related protein [Bacteroidetes bacterium]|nr:enoyl-CoA hydratase-related protein [Bacteroidota bacterium]
MNYSTLIIKEDNRISTVTINRPDKLNSLNSICKSELKNYFLNVKTKENIDVVIITGAGEKSFVAGTDISELTQLDKKTGEKLSREGQSIFDAIENCGKVVIAAINGYALGGGLELALACHIRIASENAKFGQPEVNLGIIPGYGGTQRLPRIVGISKATEMILTGNPIDTNEAFKINLISKILPQNELLKYANQIAENILSKGQIAIKKSLEAIKATVEQPLSIGLKTEAILFGECCDTFDMKEGTQAFIEKRKPNFRKN